MFSTTYITEYLSKKKGSPVTVSLQGTKFVSNCPNPSHEDKHPSCVGDMGTGAYRCLGCGCSGTIDESELKNEPCCSDCSDCSDCSECCGEGHVTECGDDTKLCPTCAGEREVACPTCKGTGAIN